MGLYLTSHSLIQLAGQTAAKGTFSFCICQKCDYNLMLITVTNCCMELIISPGSEPLMWNKPCEILFNTSILRLEYSCIILQDDSDFQC